MTYKTILVQLEYGAANETRLQWAAALARRFEARLLGFAATEVRVNVHRGMSPMAASELLRQELQELDDGLAALGRDFLAAAGEGGAWRGLIGNAESLLAVHARAADLIVLAQPEPATLDPGAIVLSAGRPVLIAAADLKPLVADTVLVAWKDSREARRAVADAMPILRMSREAVVTSIVEAEASAAREGTADVAAFLQRHGVNARAEVIDPHGDVGEALAAAAREAGADLIVSGGYSRSPLRQRVFGGMTSTLLEEQGFHRMLSY